MRAIHGAPTGWVGLTMRVIVTRPERDAPGWTLALQAKGFDALTLPLMAIYPPPDPLALLAAWQRVLVGPGYRALMFVSGNAVEHFFSSKPAKAPVFHSQFAIKTRAWAPGPGTARALLAAGVDAACIDSPSPKAGQFDSEALWAVVQQEVRAGDRVLIVRGTDDAGEASRIAEASGVGRDWLAHRLTEAGARVDYLVAYRRAAPQWDFEMRRQAQQAATDGSIWLFSSSEAVANLRTVLPDQHWSGARAVATHTRIAAAARQLGFGVVCESRPHISDVVASIESLA